jgi:hypothetical protein
VVIGQSFPFSDHATLRTREHTSRTSSLLCPHLFLLLWCELLKGDTGQLFLELEHPPPRPARHVLKHHCGQVLEFPQVSLWSLYYNKHNSGTCHTRHSENTYEISPAKYNLSDTWEIVSKSKFWFCNYKMGLKKMPLQRDVRNCKWAYCMFRELRKGMAYSQGSENVSSYLYYRLGIFALVGFPCAVIKYWPKASHRE